MHVNKQKRSKKREKRIKEEGIIIMIADAKSRTNSVLVFL